MRNFVQVRFSHSRARSASHTGGKYRISHDRQQRHREAA